MKNKPIKKRASRKQKSTPKTKFDKPAVVQLKDQLKLEAALERVRKVAMAMRKPEDLLMICKSLYRELKKVGIGELRNAMINVYDDADGLFLNYDSSGEEGPSVTEFKNDSHPVIKNFLKQVRKTRNAFAPISLQGKALKDFIKFREINGEKTDVKLRKAKALHYYFYSVGNGSMGISTLEAIDSEHIKILKRFRNVFDLAYKRYTDITLAKAQAHEVKIELALEKVRARTMAMKKSEELAEIVSVLFKQLLSLGLTLDQLRTCGITTFHPSEPKGEIWITDIKGGKITNSFTATFNEAPAYKTIYKNWKKGEDFLELNLKGKDFLEHLKFVKKYSNVPDINLKEIKKKYKEIFFHVLYFSQGYLFIITYEELTEYHELFRRFGAIFQQTYTRFLDLQKAEAQAREAQIELALERVRARTMAMQKSEELKEVIQLVYDQFVLLDIHIEHTGFILDYKTRDDMHIWLADKNEVPAEITIPYFDSPHWNSFIQARRKGTDFFANHLSFKEKNKFYRSLFKLIPNVAKKTREYYLGRPGLAISTVLLDNVGLYIENFSGIPYTSEENGTLMRFGKVFQQTYTRFLDLQKAEAQARDAQIEAALERVRSRSLAMHHSHEIKEVVLMVMEKMNELEIEMDGGVSLATFRDGSRDLTHWYVNPEHVDGAIEMHLPYFKNKLFTDFEKARKQGMELLPVVYSFEDKNEYFNYAFKHSEFKIIPKALKQWILEQPCFGYSVAIQKHSAIFFNDYSGKFFSEQENQVLIRFAKVFDQAYIRFLDLQKAEAQAREAQIETALERIRAASMAMHNSNELIKVVRLMDRAIRELGIDINGIQIVTDFSDIKKGMNVWLAVEGVDYLKKFHNPYVDHPTHHKLRQTLKDNQQFFTEKYSRVDKNRFLRFLYKHSDFRKIPKERKEFTLDALWWVRSSAINKNSILAFHRYYDKEFTEKENEILKRFGKAFEQSYTRFLDLQKAEAQAIEAQIEAALERVRSRSMGMQNTTEMQQVANETREQLLSLGLKIDALAMSGVIDNEADYDVWVGGAISQKPLRIPYNNNTRVQRDYNKVIKERPELFTKTYSGKIMKDYFRDLMATNTFNPEIEKFMLECKAFTTTLTFMKNSGMQIVRYNDQPFSDANNNIVIRFGKVFEQAYIRFLDLQNSEAQAREAQIEAALERVRARTMAMHVSEDVSEATGVLFKEIEIIGLNSMACGLNIIEDKDKLQTWTTKRLGENLFQVSGTLKLEHPSVVKLYKDWKSKKDTSIYKLKGDEVKKFYDGVYKQSDYKTPRSKKLPKILVLNNFIIPEGSLWVFTEEEIDQYRASVLKRFANVFSLTYRRYKDLQNSEAQAREAQIEAALERVRARTMAMHDSAELGEVAAALFEQISSLTYAPDRFQIAIVKEEDKSFDIWVTEQGGRKLGKAFVFKSPESPVVDEVFQAWRKKQKSLIQHLSGKKLNEWIKYVSQVAGIPFNKAQMVKDRYINSFFFSHGCIGITTNESPEAEALTLIERFVKVFQQTYTRFLDLQKAEAQAREAQIEAALERVRAQTMAMHNSEDVGNCIIKMFGELTALGVDEGTRFGIGILNHDNENNQLWTAAKEGKEVKMLIGNLDMTAHPLLKSARKAWKEQVPLHKYVLEGKDLRSYYQMLSNAPGYKFRKSEEKLPHREFHYGFIFEHGFFYAFSPSEFEPELIHITQRFSLLFAQTYRRYLDLVRAEGQAREAEIELALERVRARTMAMQRSEELPEAANTLFLQVQSLGIPAWSCGYNILSADKKSSTCIMSSEGELQTPFTLPLTEHKSLKPWHNAILKGDEFFVYQQGGDELVEHYQYMKSLPELQSVFKQFDDAGLSLPTFQVNHLAKFREGFLLFITYEPVPDAHEIFKRFTKVFEQTYTRFLDLKKAEAQAREAQIEAALERVRSRSMAMHKSEELADVIAVVSDQLQQLKIRFDHVSFAINSDEEDYHFWTAFYGKPNPYELKVPYLDNPIANRAKEVRAKGLKFGQDTLTPEENREWLEHMFKHNAADYLSLEEKSYALSRGFSRSFVLMPNILLAVGNYASKPYSKDDNQIIKRFAAVFEQSYTRFLDLQKSEAQAREAQIELSLERIRAQALAMRVSADLLDIVVTMRTEFAGLGHEAHYFWHMRWLPKKYEKAMTSGDGARIAMVMELPRHMHGDIKLLADWEKSKEDTVVYVMDADAAINYVDKMVSLGDFKQVDPNAPTHDDIRHIGGLTFIMARTTHGEIGYSLPGMKPDVPKGDLATLVRFAGAFDLAYKRFEDLLKTEAREKEAIRQASLDRVRAEIASMRTTKDLERITPLIWKELTILNIPFIRCGVFIMDEPQQLIHTFLSTPDGKAIAAFHLPYDAPGRTGEILVHWINKQVYVNHWDEAAFSELGDLLVQQGALPSKEAYLSTVPKDGIYLHCLPFVQGMLYVGNNIKLNNNDIHLIQAVADAFSTAYARYEDFNKLELAKQQVDKALVELKQAQTQLVQSEKMASLGELTAGIAHEIQNPLNFVNNFSEVSNELLVEMKEEIEKGNVEEVKAITEDVIANLEKILHHGKRADGIVKGMLQHSRSSSGVKEPTDINALADEYLRLAYHGLRAKDKSFNAKFETHFDENIGKVNVIPQDIGRVILNLITNAFYVVTERKRASSNEFEPLVIVSTKKENNRILISVKDNGNGIPDSIKEKIFQPFFTTKPTGQGTGLGLSLSYDIVKAHGGEIKIETKVGEGSEFRIQLPF